MEGLKFDEGKPALGLLPYYSLQEIAKVLKFGAEKYGKYNWIKGMDWSRLIDASLRHILAFNDGEDLDPESGLPHLAHASSCLLFLLWYSEYRKELDDRRKP